jgi:GNAT superfamily N-acetyltransferase
VVIRGGRVVQLRPIRPDDDARLVEFHNRLSPLSVYRRYFFAHPHLTEAEVQRLTRVDYTGRLALVVLDGDRLEGVGRYERIPGTSDAEVAFVVADDCQHQGIATALLDHLADAARGHGIASFVAETLADNRDMLGVFMHSGFPLTTRTEYGTVSVRFRIGPDEPGQGEAAAPGDRCGQRTGGR